MALSKQIHHNKAALVIQIIQLSNFLPVWIILYTHTLYIHTCIHTYIHTCIHSYIHTYIHIYLHTYIHTYVVTCIHTYIHTYIHIIYLHTYIHTYVVTYIHVEIISFLMVRQHYAIEIVYEQFMSRPMLPSLIKECE